MPPMAPPEIAPDVAGDTASPEQLTANRANAQHSTGPRTLEGKARSSQNAVKHGLFSNAMGYPAKLLDEQREVLDAIVADGRRRYQPFGAEEELIVDRIAALWWDLQRHTAQKQKYLRDLIAAGMAPAEALMKCAPLDTAEARINRQIRRERDDLVFLQRYRKGEHCKHTKAEAEMHAHMMRAYERQREECELTAAIHAEERRSTEARLGKTKKRQSSGESPREASAKSPDSRGKSRR
jgi:hypothetical protein